nr:XIAP-associated factor 1 [Misgurnus anguillicaudatus]
MDTEENVLCTHCNKEVAKANFDLHEPHCRRFLCLCPDCDDTVPRELLEEHKSEQHAQVKCQKCNKKMERRHLLDHETNECSERLQSCEYCSLELPLKDLLKHSLSCGSRTERCHDCGRYVQFKDQLQHTNNCSKTHPTSKSSSSEDDETDDESTSRCWKCQQSIPLDSLDEHELECKNALQFIRKDVDFDDTADFSFSKYQRVKKERHMEDLDKISTCKLCHLALPVKILKWHQQKCELNKLLSLAQ